MPNDFHCNHCGRFIGDKFDQFTDYGSCADTEEPDAIFLCLKCADEEFNYYLKRKYMPSHWIKAKYESKLAKILGFALVGSPGAGWAEWYKIGKPIPKGYEWKRMKQSASNT